MRIRIIKDLNLVNDAQEINQGKIETYTDNKIYIYSIMKIHEDGKFEPQLKIQLGENIPEKIITVKAHDVLIIDENENEQLTLF